MKQSFLSIGLLILMFGVASAGASPNYNPERLKVGAILPLSGDLAFVGSEIQRGMQLGMADFGEDEIELHFEDDRSFDKAETVRAAKKLVEIDGVQLVLNGAVNTANAVAPILAKKKIPGVVVWDNNRSLANMPGRMYSIGFSTELAGEDMAAFARSRLNLRNVSVISAHDEWSELIATSFISKLRTIGGIIDSHQRVEMNAPDLRSTILRVKAQKSEAIYAPLNPPVIGTLVRQARQLGFQGKFLVADGFGDNEIRALGKIAEGIYLTQLWVEDAVLLEKYRARFGAMVSPINMGFVGLGYDSIRLAAELKKARSSDPARPGLDAIQGLRFEGITGSSIFDHSVPTAKREPIMVVREGAFRSVGNENFQ